MTNQSPNQTNQPENTDMTDPNTITRRQIGENAGLGLIALAIVLLASALSFVGRADQATPADLAAQAEPAATVLEAPPDADADAVDVGPVLEAADVEVDGIVEVGTARRPCPGQTPGRFLYWRGIIVGYRFGSCPTVSWGGGVF